MRICVNQLINCFFLVYFGDVLVRNGAIKNNLTLGVVFYNLCIFYLFVYFIRGLGPILPYLAGRFGAWTSTVQNGGEFSYWTMEQKLFWANFWRRRKRRGIYGAFHCILVD